MTEMKIKIRFARWMDIQDNERLYKKETPLK
jgi:hypothetical protein